MGNKASIAVALSCDPGFDDSRFESAGEDPPRSPSLPLGWHQAGMRLRGVAYIDVRADEIKARSFILRLVGKETSRVHTMEERTRAEWEEKMADKIGWEEKEEEKEEDKEKRFVYHSYFNAERQLLDVEIPIVPLFEGGVVEAGRYEYPFEVDIPSFLPGTMLAEEENRQDFYDPENHRWYFGPGRCKIEYKMHVKLVGSGWFKDYKKERPLNIMSAPNPPDRSPILVQPITQEIKSCCFSNGHITFGVDVEDTRLGRGGVLGIGAGCVNQSTVDIENVSVNVTERVRWTAQGREQELYRTLDHREFLGGDIEKLRARSKSTVKSGQAMDDIEAVYADVLEQMRSPNRGAKLNIPYDARDSYSGQVLFCDHFATITITTAGCCPTNPELHVPVNTGTAALKEEEEVVEEPPPPSPYVPPPTQEEEEIIVPPTDWGDATVADPIYIVEDAQIVGGNAVDTKPGTSGKASNLEEQAPDPEDTEGEEEYEVYVPPSPPKLEPSFENLIIGMNATVDDYSFFVKKLADPDWSPVFSAFNPTCFGDVIRQVAPDYDQPRVAALLAPNICNGEFTSMFCIAAVKFTSSSFRASMVQKLLPFCSDLAEHHEKIKAELSEWEKLVTADDFAKYLEQSE